MRRSYAWNAATIAAAFLLYAVLRVLLYGRDFMDLFSQLFCGTVIVVWGLSVRERVTSRRIQRLLLGLTAFLLLFLLMQTVNFRFAQNVEALRRYAWYGYYVCEMAAAVLFYYVAVFCGWGPEQKAKAGYHLLPAAGTLVCFGVLTNDLHLLAFRFTTSAMLPGSPKRFGPLYYLFFALLFTLPFAAFVIVVRKHKAIRDKRGWFLLPLPLMIMALLYVLDTVGRTPSLGGVKLWQTGEVFCFCAMTFLELCIDFGMIPANIEYGKIFTLSGAHAVILDKEGAVRYASVETAYPFEDNEDTLVREHPVSGGKIVWQADAGRLRRLNRELEETAQQIEARNTYLSSKAKLEREIAETETRSRIYDDVTRALRPQLDRIRAMAEGPEEAFDESLPDIAVLCAYAKRRSNMELLAENGRLPFEELSLAANESLNYIRLKGVSAALTAAGGGDYPARMLSCAYERLESIVEAALETLTALVVSLQAEPGELSMRVMLNAGSLTIPVKDDADVGGTFASEVAVTKEGQDLIYSCRFREGGPV
ncbi:MAG: hypothetical protein IJK47_04215 [Lachnospiraceae bacterium]|nr:hypothetical protein [Lachnospiraceae bacterium]